VAKTGLKHAGRMLPSKQFYVARNNLPKMPKLELISLLNFSLKVVDLQCDTILKQKYTEIGIPDFYKFIIKSTFSQTKHIHETCIVHSYE